MMMFGLRNAAQTCQRFVDEIIRGLDFVYAYIDDFLIASENEAQHVEHLKILFDRFAKYGVVINPAKCVFGVSEIAFLGYPVNASGITPMRERVEAISKFSLPFTLLPRNVQFLSTFCTARCENSTSFERLT
uniref:Reverse transcriptase domain-containing protein n=1 Tax=Photinus pyralis TaxID=7054 RepID=A0A1Y1LHV5_PHOPY